MYTVYYIIIIIIIINNNNIIIIIYVYMYIYNKLRQKLVFQLSIIFLYKLKNKDKTYKL